MGDVFDILEFDRDAPSEANEGKRSKKKRLSDMTFKRPEGMHRELFALLYSDNKDNPSLIPTDIGPYQTKGQGYKQAKAKLGLKKARPWRWIPFNNPARKDGFQMHHWRRIVDEGKEYPFSKFNISIGVPSFTDAEYHQLLTTDGWSKAETDHLMDLCRRFDTRFIIIQDRWNKELYTPKSVEDLKDRYYNICNALAKARCPTGQEPKLKMFDAEHERKRKEQLIKLYNRTPEQIEEEQMLLNELRKIEMRKKEREKKTQDLQKLITAADNSAEARRAEAQARAGVRPGRKKVTTLPRTPRESTGGVSTPNIETAGIKFPEVKQSGASLRSQRMKLPSSVGQKKAKAIEQLLIELNIDLHPMPTEEICQHFNELRSDMVLLYELKTALANCEFEAQALKHQFEASQPGKTLDIPATLLPQTPSDSTSTPAKPSDGISPTKKTISEVIELGTPNRKRRAALEQVNLMKKLKKN